MFSDDLFRVVNANLVTDVSIFPDLSEDQLRRAVDYIKLKQPVDSSLESVVARFLFAKTLKQLLENPASELSVRLESSPELRKTLRNEYLESINKINNHFGRRVVAPMPGPFVIPDLKAIVGTRVDTLGRGSYGVVYSTNRGYAVKKMSAAELDSSTMREVSILRYLDHPNVINLINMQLDPPQVAMPLATGTLKDKQLDLDERKRIFYQLFRGLAYCHSKHVWHRDIKPDNVLLFPYTPSAAASASDLTIAKLADFGLSIPYARQVSNDTDVVTLWWRAPELLLGNSNYSGAIDVWSLGVMLLDAITGKPTFRGFSEVEEMTLICQALGSPTDAVWPEVQKLPDWADSYANISGSGLEKYLADPQEREVVLDAVTWPTQRSSALEILQLPYFDSVRDQIDTAIPAEPITIQTCGELMLGDQEQPLPAPQNSEYPGPKGKYRRILMSWLWQVKEKFRLRNRTLFYALLLLDLYAGDTAIIDRSKLQLYGIVTLSIAAQLFEILTPEESDYLWITAKAYDSREFNDAVRQVLTVRDFNIVVPTCNDFVYHYLKDEQYSGEQYAQVMYYAFVLTLNYKFSLEFTQAQIAQIAIETVGLALKCLEGVELIYNQRIYDYLDSFTPRPDLTATHQKYKLETFHRPEDLRAIVNKL